MVPYTSIRRAPGQRTASGLANRRQRSSKTRRLARTVFFFFASNLVSVLSNPSKYLSTLVQKIFPPRRPVEQSRKNATWVLSKSLSLFTFNSFPPSLRPLFLSFLPFSPSKMATQSMAALLSASLPAAPTAQAASSSSAPSSSTAAGGKRTDAAKDVIPAELKGGLDVEAQIAVTGVEVDGMVSFRILFCFWWWFSRGQSWEERFGREGRRELVALEAELRGRGHPRPGTHTLCCNELGGMRLHRRWRGMVETGEEEKEEGTRASLFATSHEESLSPSSASAMSSREARRGSVSRGRLSLSACLKLW